MKILLDRIIFEKIYMQAVLTQLWKLWVVYQLILLVEITLKIKLYDAENTNSN